MLMSTTSGVELEGPLVFYFSFQAMLKSLYKGHFVTLAKIGVHIINCNLAHICIINKERLKTRWMQGGYTLTPAT